MEKISYFERHVYESVNEKKPILHHVLKINENRGQEADGKKADNRQWIVKIFNWIFYRKDHSCNIAKHRVLFHLQNVMNLH